MKKPKRILSLILSALMLLSAVSCAENGEETETTADTADTVENPAGETTVETKEVVTDDLPEVTYDGYTYSILTRTRTRHSAMLAEEITGEVLNDAIYERNTKVADRFKVVFAEETFSNVEYPATLVQAGDTTHSLMNVNPSAANTMAQKNYCYSISDLEYINLDKPYWDSNLTDDISVGRNRYAVIGDANLAAIDFTNVLLFNKNLIEILQLEDVYALVNEGRWTFDKYGELAVSALSDLDGDGEMGKDDRYGMLGVTKYLHCSLIQAAGCMYITKDENNYPVYSMPTDEKMINVIEKIIEVCNDNNAWYYTTDQSNEATELHNMFRNDQGLFLTTMFELVETLRDMESDFGIVPFPKYEESQQEYLTRVSFFDATVIPVTVQDTARTSIILEALNCESRNLVIPAYYDVALKSKYARDEESSAMIDIMLSNRVLDFGDTYFLDQIRGSFMESLFCNSNKDVVSVASKMQKAINKMIEKMIEGYEEIE